MNRVCLLAALSIAILLGWNDPGVTAPAGTQDGIVVIVGGPAEWVGPGPGGGIELDRNAKSTRVAAGARLALRRNSKIRLLGPGVITIRIAGDSGERTASYRKPHQWIPVLAPPRVNSEDLDVMAALTEVLDLAGRDRSPAEPIVTWPTLNGAISRSHASIRWKESIAAGSVQVEIMTVGDGGHSWVGIAPASGGMLAGEDLRSFLESLPDSLAGRLIVEVSFPGGSMVDPRFVSLLSRSEEGRMTRALAIADSLSEPDRGILRGYAFLEARQYPDAADAYLAAWHADTTRVELLVKAADVHRSYGNTAGATRIEARLPASLREE